MQVGSSCYTDTQVGPSCDIDAQVGPSCDIDTQVVAIHCRCTFVSVKFIQGGIVDNILLCYDNMPCLNDDKLVHSMLPQEDDGTISIVPFCPVELLHPV